MRVAGPVDDGATHTTFSTMYRTVLCRPRSLPDGWCLETPEVPIAVVGYLCACIPAQVEKKGGGVDDDKDSNLAMLNYG